MPFKSEKIKIAKTKYDRRIKTTDEMKRDILVLYKEKIAIRAIARLYPEISRRTIQFIIHPELKEQQIRNWKEKWSWRDFYEKKRRARDMRNHRQYKQNLYIKKLI